MKIDKGIQETLVNNLEDIKTIINNKIDLCISNIKKIDEEDPTGVEKIMTITKILLQDIIERIPLQTKYCYFCILHSNECKLCQYKDTHGKCTDEDSTWRKIHNAKFLLLARVSNYTKGERYE